MNIRRKCPAGSQNRTRHLGFHCILHLDHCTLSFWETHQAHWLGGLNYFARLKLNLALQDVIVQWAVCKVQYLYYQQFSLGDGFCQSALFGGIYPPRHKQLRPR